MTIRCSTRGVCAVMALLLVTSCTTSKGRFVLINMAQEPIVYASVAICGKTCWQTIELNNIPPGGSAASDYDVKTDGRYVIVVEFQSGRKLRKEAGYVSYGAEFEDEITVTGSSIEITGSEVITSSKVRAHGAFAE